MARVKRSLNAKKKRKVVLERAKGYRGQRSRLYRKAKEQMLHSMQYAYRDRRDRRGGVCRSGRGGAPGAPRDRQRGGLTRLGTHLAG